MGIQPTASRSDLLLNCQYPFAASTDIPHEEPGDGARYGSAFHELVATTICMPAKVGSRWRPVIAPVTSQAVTAAVKTYGVIPSRAAKLKEHVEAGAKTLATWLLGENPWRRNFWAGSSNVGASAEIEQSYAIQPMTAGVASRPIGSPTRDGHIYEDLQPGEIAGTADLLLDKLTLDHKTGHKDFSQPSQIAQLKTLALILGSDYVAVLDAPIEGIPAVYGERLYAADREAHAKALRRSLRRIGDGSLRPGPWCKICPAREDCPTQFNDVLEQSQFLLSEGALGLTKAARLLPTTADGIGKLSLLMNVFERLSKPAKKAIRAWVQEHPNELVLRPDGKVLQFKTRAYSNLSMESIKRAYGKRAGERLIAKLRKDGAIEEGTREELWPVKAD